MPTESNSTLIAILAQYSKLTAWCDAFFKQSQQRCSSRIVCKAGCSDCCILQSVCAIEAIALSRYLKNERTEKPPLGQKKWDRCPLINNGICSAYVARPIICRTHGLPVLIDTDGTLTTHITCPLNFVDDEPESIDRSSVLDSENITMNLMKLNLSLCIAVDLPTASADRYSLEDILFERLPSWILAV